MSRAQPNLDEAIRRMGREPMNPVGQCFESAIRQLVCPSDTPGDARLCHGIGIATMPGQEGNVMGHAWVEYDHGLTRMAIDTTWGVQQEAGVYRRKMRLNYVREYTRDQAIWLWKFKGNPGPWDMAIRRITDGRAP